MTKFALIPLLKTINFSIEENEKYKNLKEAEGYTGEQVIRGTKSIDNWFGKYPKKGWNDLIEEVTSSIKKRGPQVNELRFDKKFIEVCRSIGNAPKYQYQMLQIIFQIDPDVLIHAQKAELSTEKKLMLTKKGLRQYTEIQKLLIPFSI